MCGIVGILSPIPRPPADINILRRMLGSIQHRGPDEFGIYQADHVALGSARLSIVDLAGGQQPLCTPDGRYWIVFNGEVFNYRELRQELEVAGAVFSTHTDTEVVLHMVARQGAAALTRFNGQFAFAVWDQEKSELLLARDRLGVRPLFYAQTPTGLIFGSEVKAILAYGGLSPALDPIALDQIFTVWSPIGGRTIFAGVAQLPPGGFLRATPQSTKVDRYWSLDFPTPSLKHPDLLEAELSELLARAVRARLHADVPVGAYLSGGLDSSLITALACQEVNSRLETFSIVFDDPVYDESAEQQQVANLLGLRHQTLRASYGDIATAFPSAIWHIETPILRTSPVPLFLLSRMVHQRGYKVVLTGEGADELFGGYDIFKETQVRRFWAREPETAWRASLLQRLHPFIPGAQATSLDYLVAFYRSDLNQTSRPDYSHLVRWRTTRRLHRFYSPELTDRIASQDSLAEIDYPPDFGRWHSLSKAQYLEITLFLSQYLLSSQGDRVAMAHSVEGRFPFLDPHVVQFALSLPPGLRLRGLQEKYLLRRLASRWLPPLVTKRPKQPYRAPIHRSFFGCQRPDYIDDVLSPTALARAGVFNPDQVRQLTNKAAAGRPLSETDDMALVGILSTQLWHHHFVDAWKLPLPLPVAAKLKICGPGRAPMAKIAA